MSAYEAVPKIGTLLGILSAVGIQYMRRWATSSESLLPIAAIADVGPHDMRSLPMRLYQSFFFLVFLLLPAVAPY
jgi:hypothetical protein